MEYVCASLGSIASVSLNISAADCKADLSCDFRDSLYFRIALL